jgi:mRNA interferase RelE/StbE
MTTYKIEFVKSATKEIKKLDQTTAKIILRGIHELSENPRPHGAIKLVGEPSWRLRIGNYRVIYDIKDDTVLVLILKIAHRREVYR